MKDLIILGNGMAGMTAALYAKRANLDFKIVGRDEYDFGQIANAVCVENYPCAEPLSGFDLAMKLHDQLEANNIQVEEHEVIEISRAMINNYGLGFHIDYADGTDDFCKAVIYALGASHRKLDCEIGEGIPIHYCAICDGAFYRNKTVTVIGGGDVAFTEAEYLSKICKQVIILMCDKNVTAAASTFERVKNTSNIEIIYDFPVASISYGNHPGEYILEHSENNNSIITNGIFVAIGMKPNIAPIEIFLRCWNEQGHIITNNECETEHKGFFAAGDIRNKTVRQAVTAASDGAVAVQGVINYLKKS